MSFSRYLDLERVRVASVIRGLLLIFLCTPTVAQETGPYIEEVLVTAEKRTENLQELSQAVSVFDDSTLEQRGMTSLIDLDALVPGVSIVKNEGFKTVITIRGVGNEANQNSIANPSVSYHLDGIYVASPFALQTDFLDLERVEVLRGPQGTLFGQNSTGGVVNVVSAEPDSSEVYGKLRTSVGNYDLFNTKASINLPVHESLAVRTSISLNRHAGYTENIILNQELDDSDGKSIKINTLWNPSERFSIQLAHTYFDEDINGAAQKGIRDLTPNARRVAQDSPSRYELTSELTYVVLSGIFPSYTFKSLSSSQRDEIFVIRDNDRHTLFDAASPVPTPAQVVPEHDHLRTVTQEFQFVSDESYFENTDWVAGFFYLNTTVDIFFNEQIDFGMDGSFDPVSIEQVRSYEFGDYGFISNSEVERTSSSVYFQSTRAISLTQRLIAGLRYTDDQVRGAVTNFYGRAGTDHLATSSKRFTWRMAYERDLQDATMLFGSYTRGFKPGGSNLTFGREDIIAPILVQPTFEDEIVDVLELGLKTDFADRRIRLNMAIFSYTYENLQYQATDPEVFEGGVANVPDSESFGVELESHVFLNETVDLDFSLAWIKTNIASNHLSLDNVASDTTTNRLLGDGLSLFGPEIQQARAAEIRNVEGNQLPKVPEFNFSTRLNIERGIGDRGSVYATLQIVHRGEYFYRLFNNPNTDRIDSYRKIDFFARFEPNLADWSLTFQVSNLTDEDGINSRFTDSFGVGSTSNEYIPPRQVVVGFGYDF